MVNGLHGEFGVLAKEVVTALEHVPDIDNVLHLQMVAMRVKRIRIINMEVV